MKGINFRRVFIAAGVTSLAVVYAVLWIRMISDRAERTGADFIGFFTAVRIYQIEGGEHVYDPAYQQAIEQEEVGFELVPGQVLLFNHLPYFLLPLSLMVDSNYVNSFIRWTILLLVFLVIDSILLGRLLPKDHYMWQGRWIAVAGAMLFFPVFTSIMNGQDTVFLLLGMVLWAHGLLRKKDLWAGLGLSLVTIRPQLAFILAIPMLFHKERRRALMWFVIGALFLCTLCLLVLGWEGTRNLVNCLLISASGQWYGLHLEDMPTLSGLVRRTDPGMDAKVIQFISWGIYLIAIAGLCIYFGKSKIIEESQIGLAVLIILLVVPYLHYHDLACLLVPIFCMMCVLESGKVMEARNLCLIPLGVSFILMVGFFNISIRYLIVYGLMIGVAGCLCFPKKIFRAFHQGI